MKKLFFFLIAHACLVCNAQQKLLTMQDALVNNKTSLAPENLRQLQFVKGTDDYIYLQKTSDTEIWMRGNFKSKAATAFLTLAQLNQRLKNAKQDSLTAMPAVLFNKDSYSVTVRGTTYSFSSIDQSFTTQLDKNYASKENIDQSNDGYLAYLQNHNLFVAKDGEAIQVTTDGSENIVYASSVHREEFGISKGTFWSHNGKLLAFYRMNQTMVTDYPIIDWTTRPAKNVNIKYPMAGDSSHQVTVAVYNALTQKTVYLHTEDGIENDSPSSYSVLNNIKERYLTNIAWSPDDKYVFIAILNRAQNHMWLNQYDASTGNFIKTLFEQTDEKYTEPLVPMLFVKNNPTQFIWQSRRDGWNHLYLYNINGQLIKQLTQGPWEVLDVKGFDANGKKLLYLATEESPITKNLYELDLKTLKTKRITAETGVHNTLISTSGQYIIDNYSSAQNARTVQITEVKTGKSKILLQAPNPLSAYSLGQLSIFTIPNKEGTDLYCRMYKPVGFDSTKKYPVIVYCYGGPHVQLITNSWNAGASDYWFQYMAERGYLVFTVDTRGSANRGKAFEQSIFRNVGGVQMQDLESGIEYLKKLPFADDKKMGLFGWSFGGFLTTDFVLNHPGVFKAAVAGGPVINWQYYEVMYGERYMDTPQENPEGYLNTNLIKQAYKLKGKLLIIHGLQDPVVVQQNSVNFVKACVDAGVQVDYMIYPGHEHNVLGKDRAHLYQKVTDYFMQYLQ
ncbi:MAG: DPP IV N-terminal domain-containing protein [Bacteroidetes bacterium]|nr:DPP IV N-terminal domain-containing protein [Bacteroidota bacterium]